MNYFFRTRAAGSGNTTNGLIRMTYGNTGTFSNFSSCWETNILPNLVDKDTGAPMNGMIRTMKSMEKRAACSGVCNPGLFWYTLDVTTGPPTSSCLSFITGSISDRFAPVGLAGIVSGLIMFLVWLFQYFLWCKYDE